MTFTHLYIITVLLIFVLPVVGFLILSAGEIFLLKKKKWVDEKQAVKYPLVNFLSNLPAILILPFLTGNFIVNLQESGFTGTRPPNGEISVSASVLDGIILFFLNLAVLFLIRFAVTKAIVKSSELTDKYVIGQASLLAVLLSIGFPLVQIIVSSFEFRFF